MLAGAEQCLLVDSTTVITTTTHLTHAKTPRHSLEQLSKIRKTWWRRNELSCEGDKRSIFVSKKVCKLTHAITTFKYIFPQQILFSHHRRSKAAQRLFLLAVDGTASASIGRKVREDMKCFHCFCMCFKDHLHLLYILL